jgi:hypothetical protein
MQIFAVNGAYCLSIRKDPRPGQAVRVKCDETGLKQIHEDVLSHPSFLQSALRNVWNEARSRNMRKEE